MALPHPLQVGDRVRMLRTVQGLAKGLQGTVIRKLPGTDCYDVVFENYRWPRLVYRSDLGLIEQERERAMGLE